MLVYLATCIQKTTIEQFDLFVNRSVIEALKISMLILLIAIPTSQIQTKQTWFVSDLMFNILSWFVRLL